MSDKDYLKKIKLASFKKRCYINDRAYHYTVPGTSIKLFANATDDSVTISLGCLTKCRLGPETDDVLNDMRKDLHKWFEDIYEEFDDTNTPSLEEECSSLRYRVKELEKQLENVATTKEEYNVEFARELAHDISKTGSHFVNPDMPKETLTKRQRARRKNQ